MLKPREGCLWRYSRDIIFYFNVLLFSVEKNRPTDLNYSMDQKPPTVLPFSSRLLMKTLCCQISNIFMMDGHLQITWRINNNNGNYELEVQSKNKPFREISESLKSL